ncbi:beta-lactamase/transpeptidase-like protein [Xylariaceae sp. FL1272]|nr:beta-lactamase/transpeptidase-like protein [Xylariaceae sp. FL1272]
MSIGVRFVANSTTRYPLDSLTKVFVAATIAQLLLFRAGASLAGSLTLIDLLSHQTRLDTLWLGADNEVNVPKNSTVAVCNPLSPVYPLRSQWLYNNRMYALVGEAIKRVSHTPWGQMVAERVLKQVDLHQTTVVDALIPRDSTALAYLVMGDKTPLRIGDLGLTDGTLISSAGGVRSTVHDMLRCSRCFEKDILHLLSLWIRSLWSQLHQQIVCFRLALLLGLRKFTTPARFGKMGFNPSLVEAMPVLGAGSEAQRVFYHNGALPAIVVMLTYSISHGNTAHWAAKTLIQGILDTKLTIDLQPPAEQGSPKEFVGIYYHKTGALHLKVCEKEGALWFNVNGRHNQSHELSHYHHDTFIFLPLEEQRTRRGLFHYGAHAWLLEFGCDSKGLVDRVLWNLDDPAPTPETFVKGMN